VHVESEIKEYIEGISDRRVTVRDIKSMLKERYPEQTFTKSGITSHLHKIGYSWLKSGPLDALSPH